MSSPSSPTSQAERFVGRFSIDDSVYTLRHPDIVEALEAAGAQKDWSVSVYDRDVFVFGDGSAVVLCPGGWDVRHPACTKTCWAGGHAGSTCACADADGDEVTP